MRLLKHHLNSLTFSPSFNLSPPFITREGVNKCRLSGCRLDSKASVLAFRINSPISRLRLFYRMILCACQDLNLNPFGKALKTFVSANFTTSAFTLSSPHRRG